MKTIWKFDLPVGQLAVTMPTGAEIVHVGDQDGNPSTVQVWVLVDPQAPIVQRALLVVGTGYDAPNDLPFVGTVITAGGALVWHVFDAGEVSL